MVLLSQILVILVQTGVKQVFLEYKIILTFNKRKI